VLHLQACVYLKKKGCTGIRIVNKLHRTGTAITDGFDQRHCAMMQIPSHLFGQIGRWCFFYDFLVTALGRTIPLTQGNGLAFAVAKYLHLDMTGALDKFFEKNTAVGKIVFAKAFDALVMPGQFGIAITQLHTNATTTRRGFKHHRVADTLGRIQRFVQRG